MWVGAMLRLCEIELYTASGSCELVLREFEC